MLCYPLNGGGGVGSDISSVVVRLTFSLRGNVYCPSLNSSLGRCKGWHHMLLSGAKIKGKGNPKTGNICLSIRKVLVSILKLTSYLLSCED